ncbi:uncharacterized protein MONOS_7173 [Monocercomonoides exilis]|uniref:uncharacterized protein n=1 Tax=Monocercomonoides exilis TaxID=2049356 RepID=UPI00355A9491|nr:hypothetical protein MONOS_7173 [Monocercomonoides exilis]|eukprot:MONOS_7173.1-p1 / transcript=MONOS_7173.1 / gene=MONOS_7173 / organism=Monocercomonoides_exilis_PA203 / gene_product=unspecified product / transcript_product=unspecified product / location=Mono_scaffold00239:43333-45732(+) / protein_length=571 / sequence_SO=supercontig / SO=protein_coding / is_pseudo=false
MMPRTPKTHSTSRIGAKSPPKKQISKKIHGVEESMGHMKTELDAIIADLRKSLIEIQIDIEKQGEQTAQLETRTIEREASLAHLEQLSALEMQLAHWAEKKIVESTTPIKEECDRATRSLAADLRTTNIQLLSLRNEIGGQLTLVAKRIDDMVTTRQNDLTIFEKRCGDTEFRIGDRVDSLQRVIQSLKENVTSMRAYIEVFTSSPSVSGSTLSSTSSLGSSLSVQPDPSQMNILLSRVKAYASDLQTQSSESLMARVDQLEQSLTDRLTRVIKERQQNSIMQFETNSMKKVDEEVKILKDEQQQGYINMKELETRITEQIGQLHSSLAKQNEQLQSAVVPQLRRLETQVTSLASVTSSLTAQSNASSSSPSSFSSSSSSPSSTPTQQLGESSGDLPSSSTLALTHQVNALRTQVTTLQSRVDYLEEMVTSLAGACGMKSGSTMATPSFQPPTPLRSYPSQPPSAAFLATQQSNLNHTFASSYASPGAPFASQTISSSQLSRPSASSSSSIASSSSSLSASTSSPGPMPAISSFESPSPYSSSSTPSESSTGPNISSLQQSFSLRGSILA